MHLSAQVRVSDRPVTVVRLLIVTILNLVLQNYWANQIWHKASLGEGNSHIYQNVVAHGPLVKVRVDVYKSNSKCYVKRYW